MPAIRSIAWILLLAFTSSLIACGGSSGGKGPQPKPEPEPDTKPKSFQFPDIEGAEPGKTVTSKTVTITGIDTDVRVQVDKGQYAINDGDFTKKASTLSDGDKLTLKLKASNELVTQRTATVTVGEGSATFTVITLQDTEAPKASFLFPPPMSATDADTLTVRGTVTDDYSDIESMTLTAYVNGDQTPVKVETDDGYATWRATLEVRDGAEHRLVVSTEDSLRNVEENAASVTVHEQAFGKPFPNNDNILEEIGGITYDNKRDRVLVSERKSEAIISVDMETGVRTVLSGDEQINKKDVEGEPYGLVIHPSEDKVLVAVGLANGKILSVDLENGKRELFNSEGYPDTHESPLDTPRALATNPNDDANIFIASHYSGLSILNVSSQKKTSLLPVDGPPLIYEDLLVDAEKDRLLLTDNYGPYALRSVDIETGAIATVSGEGMPDNNNNFLCPYGLASDDLSSRVLVGDCLLGIVSVDLETGKRTVLKEPLPSDFSGTNSLYLYTEEGWAYALFANFFNQGLYALDLETEEHVTISQGELP